MSGKARAYAGELECLVGRTVTAVIVDDEAEAFGLELSGGRLLWIQADPENNGPGFGAVVEDAGGGRGP